MRLVREVLCPNTPRVGKGTDPRPVVSALWLEWGPDRKQEARGKSPLCLAQGK